MAKLRSLAEFVEERLEATKNIKGFVYFGELDLLGGTWAFAPFTRWRECPLLVESNFAVVHATLFVRYPDLVQVVRASHWFSGWVEHLAVRMVDDNSEITGAAETLFELVQRIEDYPVLDDLDLGRREHDVAVDLLPLYVKGKLRSDIPEDWREQVLDQINCVCVLDDFSLQFSDSPDEVARSLGFTV